MAPTGMTYVFVKEQALFARPIKCHIHLLHAEMVTAEILDVPSLFYEAYVHKCVSD